ncbi:hypothetical protein KY289_011598 [Solanum tuberosum]|nr:hypothetical protein KY289_011598 [Solanum tuberosum]
MDGWIGPIVLGELRGMIPLLQGRSFAENGTEIAEFQILSRLEWGKTQSTILGMSGLLYGWALVLQCMGFAGVVDETEDGPGLWGISNWFGKVKGNWKRRWAVELAKDNFLSLPTTTDPLYYY